MDQKRPAQVSGGFGGSAGSRAIDAYESILAKSPNSPNSWFNLAIAYRQAGRPLDALTAYDESLSRGLKDPEEAEVQKAVILSEDLARPHDAHATLIRALSLNAYYVPALLNLGNLHEDLGEWMEAESAYRRAFDVDEGNNLALSRLIAVGRHESPEAPRLKEAEARLQAPQTSLPDRADLGFALGSALDALGVYDRAFAAYSHANRASAELARREGVSYDRRAHEQLIDRIIQVFSSDMERAPDDQDEPPIFICGMVRSGSTLIESILARHDAICAGGELSIIPSLAATALQPYPESVGFCTRSDFAEMARMYRRAASTHSRNGMRLTDKRPDNFLHVGLIKQIFPGAKIIRTVRNPLDNGVSAFFLHASQHLPYATDLADIAHFLAQERRLMAFWKRRYPGDILDVDYDAFVIDPAPIAANILTFLELPSQTGLLVSSQNDGPIRTASHRQVRRPIYRDSSGRAVRYAPFIDLLKGALQTFGVESLAE